MLVLVAGGPASGKATVCQEVEKSIKLEDPNIIVKDVNMSKWQTQPYGPSLDTEAFTAHLKQIDQENAVVLVHGNYALYNEQLRSKAAIKVFVDTDSDEQLSQWLMRDKGHRDINAILDEYLNKARIEFIDYIRDTKQYADVLLPRGKDSVGVQVISMNIVDKLGQIEPDGSYPLKKTKIIDLRKELFQELDGRYYAAT